MIVRDDLPKGTQAAQIVHAAGESVERKVQSGTHAIVLAVKNEEHLLETYEKLNLLKIPNVLIAEPDPPWCGQFMAIGIKPTKDRKYIKKALSRLPLLK